ncbi:class GN sortase [Marinobacter sp.]|uniref:class GN sortase n=1 Tax=Marinobacter sp. TaxID=50741 RepID=UPI00384D5B74
MNRLLLTLTMAFGILFTVGLWMPLKAWMAQELLTLAWAESQARQQPARPWPWADTWPVAQLELPGLNEPLIVLDGVHGESLAFGPGLVPGSGGFRATVIAGHRDTHFRALADLKTGDPLRLQDRRGDWIGYEVVRTRIVDSRSAFLDMDALAPNSLLLVTCYPFDSLDASGPLRYLVEARPQTELPLVGTPGANVADAGF